MTISNTLVAAVIGGGASAPTASLRPHVSHVVRDVATAAHPHVGRTALIVGAGVTAATLGYGAWRISDGALEHTADEVKNDLEPSLGGTAGGLVFGGIVAGIASAALCAAPPDHAAARVGGRLLQAGLAGISLATLSGTVVQSFHYDDQIRQHRKDHPDEVTKPAPPPRELSAPAGTPAFDATTGTPVGDVAEGIKRMAGDDPADQQRVIDALRSTKRDASELLRIFAIHGYRGGDGSLTDRLNLVVDSANSKRSVGELETIDKTIASAISDSRSVAYMSAIHSNASISDIARAASHATHSKYGASVRDFQEQLGA